MTDPRSLTRHIRQCLEHGAELRIAAADDKRWFLALQALVKIGALEEATYAARPLSAAFPESRFIQQLAMLLDRMPPAVADASFTNFANQEDQALQVARRTGARTTLFVFCGRFGSVGMSLPIAHRWFGPLQVHVVYLRDLLDNVFETGIPVLSEDRAGTVRALRSLAEDLETTRIVCYGNSAGGYAALLYGLEMEADAVLAFNTPLTLTHDASRADNRTSRVRSTHDFRSLYLNASKRPRAHLVYGELNTRDAASADTLSDIPGVTKEAVPGSDGHDAHMFLIDRGRFGPLLHTFVADQDGHRHC